MKIRIRWLAEKNFTGVCLVSRAVFEFFSLSEKVKYRLHLGQLSCDTFISPICGESNCIYLTPAMLEPQFTENELAVFEDADLNIWEKCENIHLGPVLGIFVNPSRLAVPADGSTVQSHMQAGIREGFLCYFFSIHSIDWESERIRGMAFVPGLDKWIFAWFPMPDVIYDRGAGFTEEQKTESEKTRQRLRSNQNIKFINSLDYIGKWKTYKSLSKHRKIVKYLPSTVRYNSFNDILMMLKKHEFIFVKAYYGSRGMQVMSVERFKCRYKLVYYSKSELRKFVLSNLKKVRKHVERFTTGRRFIIQQGIRLLKYRGRLFDMRILVIKDKKGQWRALSNYVRIAKENLTITNYCAGGECDFYHNLYPSLSCLGKNSVPSYDGVAGAAIKIASVIDREFGAFGELGMDMAIDEHGKIWFLEANTKPDKDLVEGLDNCDGVHPQYLAVFEYAGHLCGVY